MKTDNKHSGAAHLAQLASGGRHSGNAERDFHRYVKQALPLDFALEPYALDVAHWTDDRMGYRCGLFQ